MNSEPNEYALALRARTGDREALTTLIDRTRFRLFALAYAELRHVEDAQDAVASALLNICLHVRELRQPERIHAWMNSVVHNEARRLRRGPASSALRLDDLDGWGRDSEEMQTARLYADIERALQLLPCRQAQAIRLFHLHHWSIGEIARAMRRSEGTVKS